MQETTSAIDVLEVISKIIFGIFILVLLVDSLMSNHQSSPLARKFKSLGNMNGMHKSQIIKIVGEPNAINEISTGELLHWISPGYRISVKFDANDIYAGILAENTY